MLLEHYKLIPVLVILVVLLFGANKLPGLARSLGQSMRIFKSEVGAMHEDDEKRELGRKPGTSTAVDATSATRPAPENVPDDRA